MTPPSFYLSDLAFFHLPVMWKQGQGGRQGREGLATAHLKPPSSWSSQTKTTFLSSLHFQNKKAKQKQHFCGWKLGWESAQEHGTCLEDGDRNRQGRTGIDPYPQTGTRLDRQGSAWAGTGQTLRLLSHKTFIYSLKSRRIPSGFPHPLLWNSGMPVYAPRWVWEKNTAKQLLRKRQRTETGSLSAPHNCLCVLWAVFFLGKPVPSPLLHRGSVSVSHLLFSVLHCTCRLDFHFVPILITHVINKKKKEEGHGRKKGEQALLSFWTHNTFTGQTGTYVKLDNRH